MYHQDPSPKSVTTNAPRPAAMAGIIPHDAALSTLPAYLYMKASLTLAFKLEKYIVEYGPERLSLTGRGVGPHSADTDTYRRQRN
ncbi:hypothetical protein FOVG_12137 [Fusarium oxysporum f. sp. pisi HDV247]|uniref:Uncharacterized protein n=1 Tax=Fusarium oxysporum f. sp. pisi HDV247 TaxID=1080344 RepID=W9NZ27_FUSOX|nr:hypothetical protein FOVG_12137 [Fusarium oxysporum f. sp. pisi HDV247]